MPKWLSPVLLACITLFSVQFCRAQEATEPTQQTSEKDPHTVAVDEPPADEPVGAPNPMAAVAPGTAAVAADPAPDLPLIPAPALLPEPFFAPSRAPGPSEWRILGDQWKGVVPDLLGQEKRMWLFPYSVVRGHHWKPTLALVGATGLLMTLDAHNSRWVRNNLQPLSGFNNVLAGYNTATATEAFASAFYLTAILRKNVYDQQTFVLAGEAVIDSEILTTVMKDLSGREAPITYPTGGNFTDSWFKVYHGGWTGGIGSMPSGHEIAIMAVATTFADRYPHPAWHRWLAYSLAAAAGLSRVTLQAHFTSDTFAGAALGYVIAHYLVLGRHPAN